MICGWVATAVTEHICSKVRQLFNVSTSIKISRNYVCLRKLLSLFYAVGQERPILPVLPHARFVIPHTFFCPWLGFLCMRQTWKIVLGRSKSSMRASVYQVRRYRQAAADPRYNSILPPVWDELKINPKHVPPLRVGGQAGRPKVKLPTKRKASNGEYNTHSRFNAVRMKTPSSTGSTQKKSADSAVAIDGV